MLKSDSLHIRIAVESDAPALAAFAVQTLWKKGSGASADNSQRSAAEAPKAARQRAGNGLK
jgi:hypothetical protein